MLLTQMQLSFRYTLRSFLPLFLYTGCFIQNVWSTAVCLANSLARHFAPFCISWHVPYFLIINIYLFLCLPDSNSLRIRTTSYSCQIFAMRICARHPTNLCWIQRMNEYNRSTYLIQDSLLFSSLPKGSYSVSQGIKSNSTWNLKWVILIACLPVI